MGTDPHPLCVAHLTGGEGHIDRYRCTKAMYDTPLDDQGIAVRATVDGFNAGYAYMQVIERKDDRYLAIVNDNGGGSGTFSNISYFRFTAPASYELLWSAGGGDRCTGGGIGDVRLINGGVEYTSNITPYSLFSRPSYAATVNPAEIKAFVNHDLTFKYWAVGYSSAVSCVARIKQRYIASANSYQTVAILLRAEEIKSAYEDKKWRCFDNWLTAQGLGYDKFIGARQWHQALASLPQQCM